MSLNDLKKFQNGTFKEPTIGTALHRKKYPERYGYKYTSKLDQAAYPKAGTAPSEQEIQKRLDRARGPSDWDLIKQTATRPEDKKQIRDIINKEYKRNGMLNISKDEVKYVDKSLIKPVKIFDNLDPTSFLSNATQRRAVLTPKKYTEPPQYPEVLLAPLPVRDAAQEAREAALEKTREYAFRPTPNPDENKGIGSFRNTIGKELRANNSKSDWEKKKQSEIHIMEGGQMKKERDRHAHDTEVFSDIFWILSKEEPKHEPKKRNIEQMKNVTPNKEDNNDVR